ncbi:TMEM165/GDT1 family protein [Nocardia otitidiscaviarum]|uniref:TMEM165/GDT1 family protein n=1 Tax=Nocardia otitidiscaviarum TaxID=1823 RepID=UPI0004A775F4|nr:TMEM165/GDT1 family protein [Nocardia otitidiscaviarum]MBF6135958.1 TMEM165/GDT1 family protein [Nocardia otitidiscaviarum]MBF6483713.1 TMEM165/GDT1 family protein [Nocardia otitidiscaviarum]
MITTVLLSFGALFLAELGDKSQLMALTFALRYRWWVVLSAIATASVAVNLMAVGVGHFLGTALPTELISLLAAVIFLAVGLWTLRDVLPEPAADDSDTATTRPTSRSAFFVVLSAFMLAELGDRTMFATMALATDRGWLAVWIGSVVGMVAAGALAIAIGVTVGRHIPERAIATCSGLLFLYFGGLTLLGTVTRLGPAATALAAAVLPVLAGLVLLILRQRRAEQVPAAGDQVEHGLPQVVQSLDVVGGDTRGDHGTQGRHQGLAGE